MSTRYAALLVGLTLAVPAAAQTLTADDTRVVTAVRHVADQARASGALAGDVAELAADGAYASDATGLAYVYLVQRLGGIHVPDGRVTVAVGRDGRVLHAAGSLVAGLSGAQPRSPSLSAAAAASRVAELVGLGAASFAPTEVASAPDRATVLTDGGVALQPVTARLVYRLPGGDADQAPRLAWEVNLYERGAQHNWSIAIDAVTGDELHRDDWVDHDDWGPAPAPAPSLAPWLFQVNAAATPAHAMIGSYRVYAMPIESPIHASPLPPADARTLVANPDVAGGLASPFGWHDTNGVAGAEFLTTQGNNVHAYTDVDANDLPDAGSSPSGGAGLVFDFPIDLTSPPSAYRPAAVANLFYWNNVFHDVAWQYGFTEAAGNFRVNNYGRGGLGNDDVMAEAQDGSGTNNANFSTPPDGSRPRMQMYVGVNPTPDVDGDLDNLVIVHEYGHGVSNRLTGGPANVSCLNNSEQMGEGWSDFLGLMMTFPPTSTRTSSRGVGNYLFGQPVSGTGIRPAPYNTSFAVNDWTYGHTRPVANGGRGPAVPHGIGFVWATIIWEATWDLIDAHGFSANIYDATGTAGNQIALRLVIEGMKLQPCLPGFVSGRDAILAADAALYPDPANPGRGLHYATLWTAFARRGLGNSASQGSTNSNADNTEAFDVPLPPAAASLSPGAVGVSVATEASTSRVVSLSNTAAPGSQNLAFAASIQNASAPLAPAPTGEIEVMGAERSRGRDDDAGTGPVQHFAGGGPDAFGYTWMDSNEPGGPAVAFQDIAATGTPVTTWTVVPGFPGADEGYVDRALPFPFPYYGGARNSVRVSANGFIHFSSFAGESWSNLAVPSTSLPNSVIAPFWDDLDGSTAAGGTVHTGTIPDGRFVIQYTNWPRWNQASSMTFQILLSPSGTIEFQYANMTGTLNSATVGIENDAGTTGLPVAFNSTYVASNKAVRFVPPVTWVTVAPGSGNVAPGASTNLTLTFDADGLAAGLYEADLVVGTNDPGNPTFTVPVSMQVGGLTFADGAGWRMLSAPVSGMTVDNLASQNLVQGVPGYYPTAATNLYTAYDGAGWTASTGTGQVLTSGSAAIWYLYDLDIVPGGPSNSVALPMTITSPVALNEPATDVARALHTAGNRWNLVGNPFVSSLDVSGIAGWATGGTLASAVGQVWDPTISSYRLTTTLGSTLASWQGVMIENNTATGLTIPRSARDDGGIFQGLTTESRMLGFELESTDAGTGAPLFDRAIVLYFHPDATAEWDLWDASKLTPLSASYAVLAFEGMRDGEAVLKAQESRPLSPEAPFDVTLDFDAVGTGTSFTLRWPELVNVPETWTFSLQDLVTGQTVDLSTETSYTFTATPAAPGDAPARAADAPPVVASHAGGSARFVLHVTPGVATTTGPGAMPTVFALAPPAPNPATGAALLRYDVPAAADVAIEVFDLLGRRVSTLVDAHVVAGRHTAHLDAGALAAGVYVVRMRSGDFVAARRVTVVR